MILGGGQENGMRAGTENTPMIAGLGAAAEIATANLERNSENMRKTRDHLLTILTNICSDVQWISAEPVLPNTLLVSHHYFGTVLVLIIENNLLSKVYIPKSRQQIVPLLKSKVIFSTGAACHSGASSSSVLTASG